jgi:hypothetical protein
MADTDPIDNLVPQDVAPEQALDEVLDLDLDQDEELELLQPDVEPPPLGRSWAFDFAQGKFVTERGRGPIETYGVHTLHTWIEKCLRTDAGAHPIYGDDYGIVDPYEILGNPIGQVDEVEMEGKVREALLFHPRIADIDDFEVEIDQDAGAALVSFTVILDDQDELRIEGYAVS